MNTATMGIGLGVGLGTGMWALAVWLIPPRPALGVVLRRSTALPTPEPVLTTTGARWSTRLARPFTALLQGLGMPSSATTGNLAVVDRRVDDFLAEKVVLALCGLLAPAVGFVGITATGAELDVQIPFAMSIGCGATGFVLPDLRVRRHAAQRRAEFRHALSTFLDLVVISLAGGAGVDSALNGAATVGRGWAFTQLQRALTTARLTRSTPWTTLRQLGRELGITELTELAASVSLAGTEGAKVRQSLSAKAAALRAHQLTDAEGQANAATERLSLPVMALFLGFLTFIAYPAVTQILNGL